jgi:DNA polymerase III delta subunit
MAKQKSTNKISYSDLLEAAGKGFKKSNLLIHLPEKILADEIISKIALSFLGNSPDNSSLVFLDADETELGKIVNEISSGGFFAVKKIVILKNVKSLRKDEKINLEKNLRMTNPEILFIMLAFEKEFKLSDYDDLYSDNIAVIDVREFSEKEFIDWVKAKFDDYKISGDAIFRLLQLTNFSFDDVICEIEKLKMYSYFSKEINVETINECIGLSKDFAEIDFIRAVLLRDKENAMKIYNRIILKKDVEIYLIYLLSSSFIIISKLFDPESTKLKGWDQKTKLKLWYDHEKLFPEYLNFKKSIDKEKLKTAFHEIYKADKALKSTSREGKTVFSTLVENLCGL